MQLTTQDKLAILRANPHAIAVYQTPTQPNPTITVLVTTALTAHAARLPPHIPANLVTFRLSSQLTDLRLPQSQASTTCFNEPIPGGVQLQPAGQNWVGTLGAPCGFRDRDGNRRWGILSNWHVMCRKSCQVGDQQHQPIDAFPAIARLSDWSAVDPAAENTMDAAVADAMIAKFHTIDTQIRLIGPLADCIVEPQIDDQVCKVGRTTDKTCAVCTAVDACVRVGYGDFTAAFCEQAIFEPTNGPFSAPGDSGSLIVNTARNCATALLFAGNDQLTVGSPMPAIANRFSLTFNFQEKP